MSAFLAAFKALMACSTMLRNGLYGGSFLSSEFGPGNYSRIVVGWCTIINENHMFIWVEI